MHLAWKEIQHVSGSLEFFFFHKNSLNPHHFSFIAPQTYVRPFNKTFVRKHFQPMPTKDENRKTKNLLVSIQDKAARNELA